MAPRIGGAGVLLPIVDTPNSARCEDDGAITIQVGSSSAGTSPGSLGPAQCTEQTPNRRDREARQLIGAAGEAKRLAEGETEATETSSTSQGSVSPPDSSRKGSWDREYHVIISTFGLLSPSCLGWSTPKRLAQQSSLLFCFIFQSKQAHQLNWRSVFTQWLF